MKKEELDQNDIENYKKPNFLNKIPSWLKILFIKYWAAGAAFYFFGIGSSLLWSSDDDSNSTLFLYICLVLGYALVSEYIIKQLVRLMRTSRDDTFYYNMINVKGTKSFFLNLGYAFIVVLPCVYVCGFASAKGLISIWGSDVDGVDPLVFALVVTFVDFIYLFIKNSIMNYVKKHKFNKDNKIVQDEDL